jgi:NAD(P)-dependent dehydrogenase (short-subunit alcohol dehydrogenase family)
VTAVAPRGLAGKVAVIAGGATGIGAATAARLAAEGTLVVVGDVSGDGAEATAQAIRARGSSAAPVAFDLADTDSVRALIDSAVAEFGGLDLLFNVGSDMRLLRVDTDVVDIDFEVWDRTMTVTLRG